MRAAASKLGQTYLPNDVWVFYDAEKREYWKTLEYRRYGYEWNRRTPLDMNQASDEGPGRDSFWVQDHGYHPYKESVMLLYRHQ